MVVHDLNHASRYAHHMVAIKRGKAIHVGTPAEVMTHQMLDEVFGIEADIIPDPRTGVPLYLPYSLADDSRGQKSSADSLSLDDAYGAADRDREPVAAGKY